MVGLVEIRETPISKRNNAKVGVVHTTNEIALYCISLIEDIKKYDLVIEPSAGSGAFSKNIEQCIAYDIEPEHESIIKQDWFKVDKIQFDNKKVLVIGNPPFGTNGNISTKFY